MQLLILYKIRFNVSFYSADIAPLYPVEKFSILRTVFLSSGIEVPPDVTNVTIQFGDF